MVITRFVAVGLVTCGLIASSCSSTARDALDDVDANEAPTTEDVDVGPPSSEAAVPAGSQTIGQNVIDRIDETGDVTCATDKRQVETALEIHFQMSGVDATTISELKQLGVDDSLNLWTLELPADGSSTVPSVVPIAGGRCDI